jgi:arginase
MTSDSKKRPIHVIGVPLDLGAGRRGVDMGPSALRLAGLDQKIEELGYEIHDVGDLDVVIPEMDDIKVGDSDQKLRYAEPILETSVRLAQTVRKTLDDGCLPLILGGDHSIAIGSIAGSASYFKARNERMGVVWLDAHADMNTADTTPSGNIHGMSLAFSMGLGDERFANVCGFAPKLDPRHVALVGIRDIDELEANCVRDSGMFVATMRDLDERGIRDVMKQAIQIAAHGTAGVHVQLDMDMVDPEDAPGTGTPVRGGVTYREAHLAMEMLADCKAVRAIDIVEVNPILDERNRTAQLGVELVLSMLGKRIL